MNTRGTFTALATLLALIVLAACGRQTTAAGPGGGDEPADHLDGRTFLSTSVTPGGLVPGSQIRLSFQGGSVGAQAGCNSLGAQVRVDGGRLVVTGPMSMTEMACDERLMKQDEWLADVLGSDPELTLAGDTLTLRADDGTVIELVDREVADPDRPLVGTTWRLDGIVEGTGSNGAVSSVPSAVTSTLRITEAGQFELMSGCNSAGGNAEVADDVIRFGHVRTTLMGCTGEPAQVEAAVRAVITKGDVAYSIEADQLTLTNGDKGLTYRAE